MGKQTIPAVSSCGFVPMPAKAAESLGVQLFSGHGLGEGGFFTYF